MTFEEWLLGILLNVKILMILFSKLSSLKDKDHE